MRRTRLNSNSNLMFGALGNGLTVYDTSRQDGNDYLTVAHIDDTGMVKYYVDVTPEERARINKQAAIQRKKWLDSWNSRSSSAQYQTLLDKADAATLKAIRDDRKSGRVGVIEDVIDKYRDDVFGKPLTKYGYEYPDDVAVNSSRLSAKTQRAIRHCINSARRRAALQTNRRLNCGYYYDGEDYSEMGYDEEQDAYYDLPDEMYIYKLNLSQFIDLVRAGIVSKREIHEWIDELSEDWGGMPAWSPAKLIDRFEIQDLTKEQYDTWKANFVVESVRFRDELEHIY